MTIESRIQHLIDIKAGGSKTRFAAMIDVSPQHLNNILKGNVGITVVDRILSVFGDVDGRWLVTDDGPSPLRSASDLRREIYGLVARLTDLDRYTPFMSPDEIEEYRAMISSVEIPVNRKQLYHWRRAMEKSREPNGLAD